MGQSPQIATCACGEVVFECSSTPLFVAHCHCQSCRAVTGSAFATFAGFGANEVSLSQGAPVFRESSPGVQRSFCGTCGTPMSYESEKFQGQIHFYLGCLSDSSSLMPQGHIHYSERVGWIDFNDDLPKFETLP